MATNINTILDWFRTGKKPTQAQFWDSWKSFWHKDESIPVSSIQNLTQVLNDKANSVHTHVINDVTGLTNALDLKANITGTLTQGINIPNAADLNTYTSTGIFVQTTNTSAATGTNYPAPVAGKLEVVKGSITAVYQTYHVNGSTLNHFYTRVLNGTTWSNWKKLSDNADLDALISQTITDGITANAPSEDAVYDAIRRYRLNTDVELNNITETGNYLTQTTGVLNLPEGWAQSRKMLTVAGSKSANYTTQTLVDLITGLVAVRKYVNPNWSTWTELASKEQLDNLISQTITDGITTSAPSENAVFDALALKQNSLVSGTTIKTVEGQSLIGPGNIDLNKDDIGLGNVDNTSDLNKPISTAQQTVNNLKAPLASPALTGVPTAPTPAAATNNTQVATTAFVKTAADAKVSQTITDGVTTSAPSQDAVFDALAFKTNDADLTIKLSTKADLVAGKIPAAQLPSYVDDVLEFANLAAFPATGETGKLYVALDTNLVYRWSGSSYVIISSSLALGETAATAYRGDRGKIAYDHSQATGNPHGTTINDISGLTADLAAKAPIASPAFSGNPTAPTPAVGDNDTSIATTAFVKAASDAKIAQTITDNVTTSAPSQDAIYDNFRKYQVITELNLNNVLETGSYLTQGSNLENLPIGWIQGRHMLSVIGGIGLTYATQIITSLPTGRIAFRKLSSPTWSEWVEFSDVKKTLTQGANIPSGANLDTYQTTGIYTQLTNANAASGSNYPVPLAGKLEVVNTTDGSAFTYQTYHTYAQNNGFYVRTRNGAVWYDWRKLSASDITLTLGNVIPASTDLNTYTATGLYPQTSATNAANGVNYPAAEGGILEVVVGQSNQIFQKYHSLAPNNLWIRRLAGSSWTTWRRLIDDVDLDLKADKATAFPTTYLAPVNSVAPPTSSINDIPKGTYSATLSTTMTDTPFTQVGALLSVGNATIGGQLLMGRTSDNLYYRGLIETYGNWRKIVDKEYLNSFGIGLTTSVAEADLNNIAATGVYRFNDTTLNTPVGALYGSVWHHARNSTEVTQIAVSVLSTGGQYYRYRNASVWSDWVQVAKHIDLATKITKGGDTTGAALIIGTNDNFDAVIKHNNINRFFFNLNGLRVANETNGSNATPRVDEVLSYGNVSSKTKIKGFNTYSNNFGAGWIFTTNAESATATEVENMRLNPDGTSSFGSNIFLPANSSIRNANNPNDFFLLIGSDTTAATANRNKADAVPAFTVDNANAASTGAVQSWKSNGVTIANVNKQGQFTIVDGTALKHAVTLEQLNTKQDLLSGSQSNVVRGDGTPRNKDLFVFLDTILPPSGFTPVNSPIASGDTASAIASKTQGQLNAKQDALVSGTTIKTVGGQTILGSGNVTEVQNALTASTVLAPSATAVNTALALKAPLASPPLTGTPTAPTATAGTNTTQIATTAFVKVATDATVAQTITNGVTTSSPSQDVVFDALALKQDALVSDTNIKTVSGVSILGSGDVYAGGNVLNYIRGDGSNASFAGTVQGSTVGTVTPANTAIATGDTFKVAVNKTQGQINNKQDTLISGTTIKTVGGQTILGSGNVTEVQNALTASTVLAPSATAVNTALALKAPLASPPLTGTPTAPTATAGTNTTQIATTAFVNSNVDGKIATLQSNIDNQYIPKTGAATKTDTLTFTNSPIVPDGTLIGHPASIGQLWELNSKVNGKFGPRYQTVATITFPTTPAQSYSDMTYPFPDVSVGDFLEMVVPIYAIIPLGEYKAWISASATVTIRFTNYSNTAKTPPTASFKLRVLG